MKQQGLVKWFDDAKGYGFLQCDDGCPDVFCHWSAIIRDDEDDWATLLENDKVEFDVVDGRNGKPAAANVQRIR